MWHLIMSMVPTGLVVLIYYFIVFFAFPRYDTSQVFGIVTIVLLAIGSLMTLFLARFGRFIPNEPKNKAS